MMRYAARSAIAFSFLLTSQAWAQEPSFTTFGQGCGAGGFALPSLDSANGSLPTIDDQFSIRFKDLPFRTSDRPGTVIVFLGFSNSNWRGISLPLDLGPHGAAGCTLYVSDNLVAMQGYAGHSARWTVDIPNDSSLLDLHFFTQGLVLEPDANFLGIVTTNAAEGVVGLNRGPEASIVFPPPQSLTHEGSILIRGKASDQNGIAEVRVNGQVAITSDGYANWELELPLSPGTTTITIQTLDNLGFINLEAAQAQIESQAKLNDPRAIAFAPPLTAFVGTIDSIVAVDLNTGDRRVVSDDDHGSGMTFFQPRGIAIDGSRLLMTAFATAGAAVIEVDLATGNRRLISDASIVTNPSLSSPWGIVRQGGEALVVVQDFDQPTMRFFGSIVGVNLASGQRRVISSGNGGVGERLIEPIGIALDGNRALVTDELRQAIFTVDLLTGDRGILSGGFVGTGPPIANPVGITVDGDRALVVEKGFDAIYAVDLATGNRSVVSDASTGIGPNFMTPWAITKAGTGALVTDIGLQAVFSIDLVTGDRAVLSKSSIGTGPPLLGLTAVSLDQGRLLVLDIASKAIVQIDRETGNRRVISGLDRGTGPDLSIPTAFAVEGDRAYVVDRILDAVIEVNLLTGDRRVVSDSLIGSGPQLGWPVGIALMGARALVIDKSLRAVMSVDLMTGERRLVSGPLTGSGPPLHSPEAIVLDGDRALIADGKGFLLPFEVEILAVDLATGDRTILSDNQTGTGPALPLFPALTLDGDRVLVANGVGILAIDTLTGDRSLIATNRPGSDPFPGLGIAVDGDQVILIGGEVTTVDLQTNEQVIISK